MTEKFIDISNNTDSAAVRIVRTDIIDVGGIGLNKRKPQSEAIEGSDIFDIGTNEQEDCFWMVMMIQSQSTKSIL